MSRTSAEHPLDYLGKSLDEIFRQHDERSFTDLIRDYDSLLEEVTVRVNQILLDARRLVAERVFVTAIRKHLSRDDCGKYLRSLEEVGFFDLMDEYQCRVPFCRYLIKQGEKPYAEQMLQQLRQKVLASDDVDIKSNRHELLNLIDDLLRPL